MRKTVFASVLISALFFLEGWCADVPQNVISKDKPAAAVIPIDLTSSIPGTSIEQRGEKRKLIGAAISIGSPLPSKPLIDAYSLKKVDLSQLKGKVLLLSIVPSLDTKVCESQTHYLGEQGAKLPQDVVRVVISRDLPFAQKRFAEESKLTDLTYLSDYQEGSFGLSTGLLIDENKLLARSVVLVGRDGIVRYLQVVPELSHLPDMETIFDKSIELLKIK